MSVDDLERLLDAKRRLANADSAQCASDPVVQESHVAPVALVEPSYGERDHESGGDTSDGSGDESSQTSAENTLAGPVHEHKVSLACKVCFNRRSSSFL